MFRSFEVDHALHFRILLRSPVFGSVRSRSYAKGQFCILYRLHTVSYLIGLIFMKVSVCSRFIFLFDIMARKVLLYMTENLMYAVSII